MSSLQVAILTPVFWPVANQTLASVRGLAEAWRTGGAEVTFFTERLEPDWAVRIRYRDWDVVRVERPAMRPWSKGRFGKVLLKALTDFRGSAGREGNPWDAVVICGWPEALLALDGANDRLTDRLFYWTDRPPLPPGQRATQIRAMQTSLQQCTAILSPHPRARRWLEPFEHGTTEVHCLAEIGDDEEKLELRIEERELARKSLAELHPLLNFERNQPLGLCAAEMSGDPGLLDLLAAWRTLRREKPRATLVLVGDGPQARVLWERVHDWHLQGNVVMPGCFDDLTELLQAADFYVHPLRGELTCPFLSRALAVGQACVVSSSNPVAEVLTKEEALFVSPGNVSELTSALRQVTDDSQLGRKIGVAGARAFGRFANRGLQQQLLKNLLGAIPRDLSGAPR